ncbi:hypothetical protein ATR1_228c0001, partial [Acetobacter tropicalis]
GPTADPRAGAVMSASLELGDIFRAAGPAWRSAHAGRLPLQQLKVMSA